MTLQSRLQDLASAVGADIKGLRGQIDDIKSSPPQPTLVDGGGPTESTDPNAPGPAVVSDNLLDLPFRGLLVQTGLGPDGTGYTIWFDDGRAP